MSIERARLIALPDILEKIKSVSTQQTLSCISGLFQCKQEIDSLSAVKAYLASRREGSTDADAVRWINIMFNLAPRIAPAIDGPLSACESKYRIENTYPVKEQGLLNDLEAHCIPLHIVRSHLYEVQLYTKATNKPFFALGYRNEENGQEIFNPFIQTTIGRNGITFIRGTCLKRYFIHVFVHMRDFLAAVAFAGEDPFLKDDSIILNSMHNLQKVGPYIYKYGYRACFTWMNNDQVGERATTALHAYFQTEDNLRHCAMNKHYHGFTSLHESYSAKQQKRGR